MLDAVGLEYPHLLAHLDVHQQHFGRAPTLLAGDRGLYSPDNAARARERGVKRIVLPQAGRVARERPRHERQRWFRRGYRLRAGAEGRISVLKRDYYFLDRCRDHGAAGFGRRVGWGIVAHNLAQIARMVAAREVPRLIGTLAYHMLSWARHGLAPRRPQLARYGLPRFVRDGGHLSGLLRVDGTGRGGAIVLHPAAPCAARLAGALDTLLAAARGAVRLGQP